MVSLVKHDLEFILKQIKIAEAHTAGAPLTDLVSHDLLPYGLRTVNGSYNNLGSGNELYGSADQIMPRLLDPVFNPAEGRPAGLHPGVPAGPQTSYAQTSGSVYDSQPRIISNLIADQTIGNPATVIAALVALGNEDPYAVLAVPANTVAYDAAVNAYKIAELAEKNLVVAQASGDPTIIAFAQNLADQANAAKQGAYENLSDLIGVSFEGDTVVIPNVSADLRDTAPFNGFLTLFGQFFDHGLDLVSKGGSGTVYVPLEPDDPLYVPGSPTNFMVLTRAQNQPGADGILGTGDDVHEHANETTPWVDLNQVYTSNPSHQVFLREYVMVDGKPVATGHMLEGATGGPPTWADIKAQAANLLGIELTDADVLRVPAVLTDLYGEFIRDGSGMPQLVTASGFVSGNLADPAAASQALSAGRAFLNDIAHTAVPVLVDHDSDPVTPAVLAPDADSDTGNAVPVDSRGNNTAYDDELLDRHYIVGDGRGNENIGLTSVHTLFHHEHNRQVEAVKDTILATGDLAFINEWLAVDVAAVPASQTQIEALVWDGERLFQAGRFSTEMVYQHLVFEEFARAVSPNIDAFLFSNTVDIDPAIVAEFAHVVYRFGHSMLTENIDRLNLLLGTDGETTGIEADRIGLIEAFLNPVAFDASGIDATAAAGAILRGMSRQVGNEIDEHLTDALRNNLVGLPLDLGTLNLTRARETGVPSLNAARRDLYEQTQDSNLKPYASWFEFALAMKNPASLINFIAAYGTHATILAAETGEEKRDAATVLVLGGSGAPADRLDFLNGTGAWASAADGVTITGLDAIDFWIGGLAEKKMPFGGMLGSTFNFVFEAQMEKLQEGDRFYYLSRTQGLNLLNELEADSFAELVMRNTDTGDSGIHMNGLAFQTADYILEMDPSRQFNAGLGTDDPVSTNPILQAISPMVVRQDLDGDGDYDYLRFTGTKHVVLGGTAEDDVLIGGEGDDTLWGGAGNDRLEGGFGVDHIHGGDGHDIITDSGTDVGAADVLDGEDGDDFINGGMGLDLIFGGRGSDFLYGGSDDKTISGGQGNDFIRGPSGLSTLMGNEGDDWIEGGDSFDTLAGENSELFFNSTIIGHDVLNGRGNDNDYDGESGDDIMFQGPGIQRNNGMAGFDWAIHKGNAEAADSDMTIKIFENQQNNILRDRFDLVEGLSGWMHDDVLIGRQEVMGAFDDGENAAQVDPNAPLDSYSNALLEKNVHLIDGLDVLVAHLARTQVTVAGVTETIVMDTSDASDIILGGGGSDLIRGNAGNDIIDGDAWLNARIQVNPDASRGQTWAPFSIDSLDEIQARVASGEIRGSQLQIVREILYSNSADDFDTAVFSGVFANYTIFELEDGSVVVTDTVGTDGSDRLTNIERLQFADQTITLGGSNSQPDGQLQILDDVTGDLVFAPAEDQVLRVSDSAVTDPDGIDGPISFQWQREEDPGSGIFVDIINETGETFTPSDDQVGLVIRVVGTFTDGDGVVEQVISWSTDPVANENDPPTGAVQLSDMTPTQGRALVALTNQIADLDGLGAFTFQWEQSVDGVNWIDIADATLQFFTPGADHVGQLLRVVVSYVDDGGTTETLTSSATGVAGGLFFGTNAPNTLTGTAGQDEIYGEGGNDILDGGADNDTIEGGAGADTITGGDGDDVLTGGLGPDSIDGGLGNDTIVYTFGDGADLIVNGGGGTDTLEITGTSGNDTLNVSFDGAAITVFEGGNLLGIEAIHADLLDGADTLTYAGTTANVAVDLGAGTASGFTAIAGIENVTGGTGADTLTGDAADNVLNGGAGNDTLAGGEGGDTLTGGAGDDTLTGGLGADTLNGGANIDTASYAGETDAFAIDLAAGTARRGAAAEDTLIAIENVTGGAGNDTISGSGVANVLNGGSGNDTLAGLGGADTLIGGLGDDDLTGGAANDIIQGGDGNDTIRWMAGEGRDIVSGGTGTDRFVITGSAANETFFIETVADYLARVGAGADTLQAGTEIVVSRAVGAGASAVLAELTGIDDIDVDGGGGSAALVVSGDFSGTDLNPNTITFRGSGANDTLNISGRTSDHRVHFISNGGNDTIIGAFRPTDVLELDPATLAATPTLTHNQNGTSTLQSETCRITAATGSSIFTAYSTPPPAEEPPPPPPAEEPPAETAPLSGTDRGDYLRGTDEADHILGLRGDDKLYGRDGDDILDGGKGEDRMYGGRGDDTYIVDDRDDRVSEERWDGTDTVETTLTSYSLGRHVENLEYTGSRDFHGKGNGYDNAIAGGAGDDRLEGRDGDDVITGGAGDDKLWGGDDSDTFVFAAGFGNDRIYDFDADPRKGQDLLDLSELGITAENFARLVDINVNCGDTVITIGDDSITLLGVNGRGSNAITQADFIL